MHNNSELIERLRRKGITVTSVAVDFFYTNPKPMNQEERSMWFPHLVNTLRTWSNQYHGKEPDKNITTTIANKIKKEYGNLSISEIHYCLDRVTNGDEEIKQEWNLNANSILTVLKRYAGKKQRIKTEHYAMQREEAERYEAAGKIQSFLSEAKHKYNDGQELTIYERSVLGKELLKNVPTNEINDFRNLFDENKDYWKKQEQNNDKLKLGDDVVNYIPLIITEEVLFNARYFDTKA